MIIQDFSFGNFRSFKEIQTLSLTKAKLTSKKDKALEGTNTFAHLKESFLKSKVLYGANASGKSNLIKALSVFLKIISQSVKDEKVLERINSFRLSADTMEQPSFFQMIFWIDENKYRYGFQASDKAIHSEWLYERKGKKETCYFIREQKGISYLNENFFKEGDIYMGLAQQEDGSKEFLFPTSLFLKMLASFPFAKISKSIIEGFNQIKILSGLGDATMAAYAREALRIPQKKSFMLEVLKGGDTSVEKLGFLELNNEPSENMEAPKKRSVLLSAKKFRGGVDEDKIPLSLFAFEEFESEGTQRLFEYAAYLYDAFYEKKILIIDQFDALLHPLLAKKLVALFNSSANEQSQFVLTTNNTQLLLDNLLRRDQISFVEKDKEGSSHLYALAEIAGVKGDTYERDYLHGKYGAIPIVGDFNELFEN